MVNVGNLEQCLVWGPGEEGMCAVPTMAGQLCQSHITSRHSYISTNPPHANACTLTWTQTRKYPMLYTPYSEGQPFGSRSDWEDWWIFSVTRLWPCFLLSNISHFWIYFIYLFHSKNYMPYKWAKTVPDTFRRLRRSFGTDSGTQTTLN